jgi:hypothetical protein
MKNVFTQTQLEKSITACGFVVVDQLIPNEICDQLTTFFNTQNTESTEAFTISNWSSNISYREETYHQICDAILPFTLPLLENYKPVMGVFTVKQPEIRSEMPLHQDWSLVDESIYRSVSIWVALSNMDHFNGNLQVATYSHIYANQPRGMNMPVPFESISKEMYTHFLVDVPLTKGSAIIFDHRLIHASPSNESKEVRLAAVLAMIPQEADLIHYYKDLDIDNEVELLKLDEVDFRQMNFFDMPNRPKFINRIEKRPFKSNSISVQDIVQTERIQANQF